MKTKNPVNTLMRLFSVSEQYGNMGGFRKYSTKKNGGSKHRKATWPMNVANSITEAEG